jgi:ribosomal protein S18 acetylase RimI-like enzyme
VAVCTELTIEPYDGDRRDLLWSFRLAEDSEEALAGYLDRGRVWVARDGSGTVLGHAQAVGENAEWELLSTAVAEDRQSQGIGRRLVEHVVAEARTAGATRLVLATAAADIGNLRFYQRVGLRMERVVPDAFTPETGYPDPIEIDGIPLRDQVWFGLDL